MLKYIIMCGLNNCFFPLLKRKKAVISLVLAFLFMTCSKSTIPIKSNQQNDNGIIKILQIFESDLKNSSKVISEQELIKNLSHLMRMNSGGNKYYPLERDALTKMIKELSSFEYSECVLVNKAGLIIYSMYDDSLLSKKAEALTRGIGPVFTGAKEGTPFISDTIEYPQLSGRKVIIFGLPVFTDNQVQGILIAAIQTSLIEKVGGEKRQVVNSQGIIMFDAQISNVLLKCNDCEKDLENPDKFIKLNYHNIKWFMTK